MHAHVLLSLAWKNESMIEWLDYEYVSLTIVLDIEVSTKALPEANGDEERSF
jgi:hypothetical protein